MDAFVSFSRTSKFWHDLCLALLKILLMLWQIDTNRSGLQCNSFRKYPVLSLQMSGWSFVTALTTVFGDTGPLCWFWQIKPLCDCSSCMKFIITVVQTTKTHRETNCRLSITNFIRHFVKHFNAIHRLNNSLSPYSSTLLHIIKINLWHYALHKK